MFRLNPEHTGLREGGAGTTWAFAAAAGIDSSPALVDGVVYFGSDDGSFYAADEAAGSQLWSFAAAGGRPTSPAVVDGLVFFGSSDHRVYALDATTGTATWDYLTDGEVRSSPAVVDGILYVGSNDGNVYALSAESGALLWKFATGYVVDSSPTVVGGVVYVGSFSSTPPYDGGIFALDAYSGDLIWKHSVGVSPRSSPAVADGVVYIGTNNGELTALDSASGSLLWRFFVGVWQVTTPTVVGGIAYFGTGDYGPGTGPGSAGSMDHSVFAVDASSGLFKWQFRSGAAVLSSPAVAGGSMGSVYVGSNDNKIYALNAANGAQEWHYATGDAVTSSPATANGVVYVGSSDNHLYAVNQNVATYMAPPPSFQGVLAHPIDIEQPCFHLTANDFWIELDDGRIFSLDPAEATQVSYNCDPGDAFYTTIELTWHQHGVEMRFNAYLQSDGSSWWSDELRIYNGASQSDWLYAYGDFFRSDVGQPFQAASWEVTAHGTGNATNGLPHGEIHFDNLDLIAFHQTVPAATSGSPEMDAATAASQPADAPQTGAKSTGIVMPELGQAFGTPLGIIVIGTTLTAAGFGSFTIGWRHGRTKASQAESASVEVGGDGMPEHLAAPMPKPLLAWFIGLGIPVLAVGILGLIVLGMISRTEEDLVGWTMQNVGAGWLLVAGLLAAVPLALPSAHLVAPKRWSAGAVSMERTEPSADAQDELLGEPMSNGTSAEPVEVEREEAVSSDAPPASSGDRLAGKRRTFGRGIGMIAITLEFYILYWHYKARKELHDQFGGERFPAGLYVWCFVPIVNIICMPLYMSGFLDKVNKLRFERNLPPIFSLGGFLGWYMFVPIAGPFVAYSRLQNAINDLWDLEGQAEGVHARAVEAVSV